MRVLFCINEATPLYKLGGLGDVGGSLPPALMSKDVDIRLGLPLHPEITLPSNALPLESITFYYNGQRLKVTIYHTFLPNSSVPVYLFLEPRYLSSPTGPSDNYADKYAVFSAAVAAWINGTQLSWKPHLIHLNDWHTALIPVILKHIYSLDQYRSLITIHNLAYQGVTQIPIAERLSLPPGACQILSWDAQDGDTNILLEGILHSDLITTVSPSYATEIVTTEFGEQLDSILTQKQTRLFGILNGLDQNFFNPATDRFINHRYSPSTAESTRPYNKVDLQKQLQLVPDPRLPLVAFIGRVDPKQKGIDLLYHLLSTPVFTDPPAQFVFLGTGDPFWETKLHQFDTQPNIRIITRFDEPLAHLLYAGSDLLLIPSSYEPCGLIQLIAMRYGSLPVAHAVGGLRDTIIDNQTGFLYTPNTQDILHKRLQDALRTIANPSVHHRLVQSAMKVDSSWVTSARQYAKLYRKLV